MRILLINVPHPAIGSRIPDDHLPPLGLLSIGGPLIDDGHDVRLIDGEFGPMPTPRPCGGGGALRARRRAVRPFRLDVRAPGHRRGRARASSRALPGVRIVYGGVFPTYHWREILAEEPHVDGDRARRRRGDGAAA